MLVHTLLADPEAIRLVCIRPSFNDITMIVKTASPQAQCPRCQRRSSRIHCRYLRRVADLPWHGVSIKLEMHTRRFCCRSSGMGHSPGLTSVSLSVAKVRVRGRVGEGDDTRRLTTACTRPAISGSLKLKGSSGRAMPGVMPPHLSEACVAQMK